MNTKKQSDKLAIGALSATIVALLSYFMDLVSTSFFRFSGFKFLSEAFGYLTFSSIIFIIGFAATVGSIITAFLAMKNPDFRRITMIVSAVALGAMLYFAIDAEIFDYAGFGFWLFIIGHIGAIGLTFASNNAAKKEASSDTSNGYYTYDQPAKQLCPNCKGELEPGAAFCKYCGAYVNQN